MTDDTLEDDEIELEKLLPETPLEYAKRMAEAGRPPPDAKAADPDLVHKAAAHERKRWEDEALDEKIREASLRAWEKERLADAEGREGRLVPFDNRDPYEYRVDKRVPRVSSPKEKAASRYESCTDPLEDVETELTAVIAECRYFMREMAFESARTTPIVDDRIRFIESARSLAEVSAKVGHSVATVRNPALIEPEEKKRARR